MTMRDLLAAVVDELPRPQHVEPRAFLDDALLPRALAPLEPAAFTLACMLIFWGRHGPRN
jgi:hypothetical protein